MNETQLLGTGSSTRAYKWHDMTWRNPIVRAGIFIVEPRSLSGMYVTVACYWWSAIPANVMYRHSARASHACNMGVPHRLSVPHSRAVAFEWFNISLSV